MPVDNGGGWEREALEFQAENLLKVQAELVELREINEQHRVENAKLRETVRCQGEFIQSMRDMIRDFVYGTDASLGRLRRAGL